MARFVVTRAPGPAWEWGKPTREQAGWDQHAAFMDALVDERFVVFGGPAGNQNKVVLAVEATDVATVRARLARDPWSASDLLRTIALDPWTTWLGGEERLAAARHQLYLVAYAPGPRWADDKARREQAGWEAHAAFMDKLVAQAMVLFGGPLDGRRALLVMQHHDRHGLREQLAGDPWYESVLTIEDIEPWSLWLHGFVSPK